MTLFSKKDLFYKDYNWTDYPHNDLRMNGKPDTTPFNRLEGNEVVYLINKLMILWSFRFANSGNRMEKLLREMPEELKSQIEVQHWLQKSLKL